MTQPKHLPDDYRSDDTWVKDRGPHHCAFCGYDIITKNSSGERHEDGYPKFDQEVQVDGQGDHGWLHPIGRWHRDCAEEDPRYHETQSRIRGGYEAARKLMQDSPL